MYLRAPLTKCSREGTPEDVIVQDTGSEVLYVHRQAEDKILLAEQQKCKIRRCNSQLRIAENCRNVESVRGTSEKVSYESRTAHGRVAEVCVMGCFIHRLQ